MNQCYNRSVRAFYKALQKSFNILYEFFYKRQTKCFTSDGLSPFVVYDLNQTPTTTSNPAVAPLTGANTTDSTIVTFLLVLTAVVMMGFGAMLAVGKVK